MYFYDIERNYSILPEKVVFKKIKSFKNQYPNPLNIVVRGKNDQSNVLFRTICFPGLRRNCEMDL